MIFSMNKSSVPARACVCMCANNIICLCKIATFFPNLWLVIFWNNYCHCRCYRLDSLKFTKVFFFYYPTISNILLKQSIFYITDYVSLVSHHRVSMDTLRLLKAIINEQKPKLREKNLDTYSLQKYTCIKSD